MRSPAAGALAAALLAACHASPLPEDPYVEAITRAATADRADRFAEAADEYERAASLTADGMIARTAIYRAGQAAERAGQYDRALAIFLMLADDHPGTPEAARGLYDAAQLHRRLGNEPAAIDLFVRLVDQEPDSAMTSLAVRRLSQIFEDHGDLAGLDRLLTTMLDRTGHIETRVVLRYFRALERAQAGRVDGALSDVEDAVPDCPYPDCSFWDDLLWQAATICRDAGRWEGAVEYIDRLVAFREEGWMMSWYYSVFYDDAQFLKGELLRDNLDRPEEAAEAFLELEDFRDSILADDGVWEAARIRLDVLGDADRGCDLLRDLVEDYPDSNRMRAVRERLDAPPCAGR